MMTSTARDAARADLEHLFVAEAETYPSVVHAMFNKTYGSQNPVYMRSITGFGEANVVEDGALIPEDETVILPRLTLTAKTRGKKYRWTHLGQKTDQYSLVQKSGKSASKVVLYKRETDAVNVVYNNAFDSAYPIATGSAFFSNTHSIGGQTFDNLYPATALSESAIAGMLTQLRSQKNARNLAMPMTGKMKLLVSPSDEFDALKIAQSQLVPGTADNDKNVVSSRFDVVVLNEAISTTAYVMIPENMDEHYLQYYEIDAPNTGMEKLAEGHITFVNQMAYAQGIELPYNCIGSAGA